MRTHRRFDDEVKNFLIWVLISLGLFVVGLYAGGEIAGNSDKLLRNEMTELRAALELYPNSVVIMPGHVAAKMGYEPRRKDLDLRLRTLDQTEGGKLQ